MRAETIRVSETDLMFVIAGQLFDQAPNRQPRKVEIIMRKVRDSFRKMADNHNEWYTFGVEKDKLYDGFHDLLFAIPEFRELNLTQIEFEQGISVDDKNRSPFKFSTRYDVVLVYKCGQEKLNNLYYQVKEQRRCSTWRRTKNLTLRNLNSRLWICIMPEEPRIQNWNVNMA